MSPRNQDFKWVTALRECTVEREFGLMKKDTQANRDEFVLGQPESLDSSFTFKEKQAPPEFWVSRRGNQGTKDVSFRLNGKQISVFDIVPSGESLKMLITPFLNDEGECRYRIGGKGEFLRWQVLRKALKDLFFNSSRD